MSESLPRRVSITVKKCTDCPFFERHSSFCTHKDGMEHVEILSWKGIPEWCPLPPLYVPITKIKDKKSESKN